MRSTRNSQGTSGGRRSGGVHASSRKDDDNNSNTDDLYPIHHGFPPYHSTFLVGCLLAISSTSLPTFSAMDEEDDDDTIATTISLFTHRIFPSLIPSVFVLGMIRLMIGFLAWTLTIYLIVGPGWDVNPNYKTTTKLRRRFIKLRGVGTLYPFTSWCWVFLGTSFVLNGLIAISTTSSYDDNTDNTNFLQVFQRPWILRTALIVWELAAPFALLVSAVVRWAIWPVVEASGKPHFLGCFRNQMQHNINSIVVLVETALLGGLPVYPSHLAWSTFVGVIYILFSWIMGATVYGNKRTGDGPQYLYWFFDITLGKTTTIALVALLSALMMSFGIFVAIETLIETLGGNFITNLTIVIGIASVVCRFR